MKQFFKIITYLALAVIIGFAFPIRESYFYSNEYLVGGQQSTLIEYAIQTSNQSAPSGLSADKGGNIPEYKINFDNIPESLERLDDLIRRNGMKESNYDSHKSQQSPLEIDELLDTRLELPIFANTFNDSSTVKSTEPSKIVSSQKKKHKQLEQDQNPEENETIDLPNETVEGLHNENHDLKGAYTLKWTFLHKPQKTPYEIKGPTNEDEPLPPNIGDEVQEINRNQSTTTEGAGQEEQTHHFFLFEANGCPFNLSSSNNFSCNKTEEKGFCDLSNDNVNKNSNLIRCQVSSSLTETTILTSEVTTSSENTDTVTTVSPASITPTIASTNTEKTETIITNIDSTDTTNTEKFEPKNTDQAQDKKDYKPPLPESRSESSGSGFFKHFGNFVYIIKTMVKGKAGTAAGGGITLISGATGTGTAVVKGGISGLTTSIAGNIPNSGIISPSGSVIGTNIPNTGTNPVVSNNIYGNSNPLPIAGRSARRMNSDGVLKRNHQAGRNSENFKPQNQQGNIHQPQNQPGNGNRQQNQSGNGNQPQNQPGNGNQPQNQQGNSHQPQNQPGSGNKPQNQPGNGNQPQNRSGNGNQPQNQSGNGNKPQNQSGNGNRQQNQSGNGNQPQNQSRNGNQPQNQPGNGNQPQNQSRNGNQPQNQPGNGNQPQNRSGNGNRQQNQSGNGNQPQNQPGNGNQPQNQQGNSHQPQNQPGNGNKQQNQPGNGNKQQNQPGSGNRQQNQPGSGNKPQNQPGNGNKPPKRSDKIRNESNSKSQRVNTDLKSKPNQKFKNRKAEKTNKDSKILKRTGKATVLALKMLGAFLQSIWGLLLAIAIILFLTFLYLAKSFFSKFTFCCKIFRKKRKSKSII